jgi:hypothetical protein
VGWCARDARHVLAVLLLAIPVAAEGQTVLLAGYGHNADDATGLETGEAVTLGLTHFRSATGLVAAVGLPLDPDASSRWGTIGGWFDHRPATSTWGITGAGTLFAFGDPILDRTGAGSVLSLDGYTIIGLDPAVVRLRLGARHGSFMDGEDSSQRLLGRAGTEVGFGTGELELRAELDHWRAEEGGYTQAGARVAMANARFQAWAGVSRWLDDDLPGTGWDVGARVPLTERLALTARGGVQAEDILFQVPPQRSWSLGLQFRMGPEPLLPSLAVPVLIDRGESVTLTLPTDDLGNPPAVAGTFSGWQTLPMQRVGDRWRLELVLEPGVHEYAFVTSEGEWFVPEGTPGRRPDGFGGFVAVLIVQ